MTKIQEEVMESAQLTDTQEERQRNEAYQMTQMLHHLTMMMKLLGLWLTEESRYRLQKMLDFYHPVDRAAMAYALVVYVMTGTKMSFKSAVAKHHYKLACQMLKDDMPTLMFAGHMRYMIRKYGPKKNRIKN